jgi:hypothetical protein
MHHRSSGPSRFAPGALAPVRVIVSRSIFAYLAPCAPLAGTARLRRSAAYTRCLRCVPTGPRRPASGSMLSLPILSRHVALNDSGTAAHAQFLRRTRWPSSKRNNGLGTSNIATIRFAWRVHFGALLRFTCATTCRVVCPPGGSDRASLARPTGTFTSGLPVNWSPVSSPDIATVATGQVPRVGLTPTRMAASLAALRFAPTSRPVNGNTHY